jgi:hypothetical protein
VANTELWRRAFCQRHDVLLPNQQELVKRSRILQGFTTGRREVLIASQSLSSDQSAKFRAKTLYPEQKRSIQS